LVIANHPNQQLYGKKRLHFIPPKWIAFCTVYYSLLFYPFYCFYCF